LTRPRITGSVANAKAAEVGISASKR